MSIIWTLALIPDRIKLSEISDFLYGSITAPHREDFEFPLFRMPCECLWKPTLYAIDLVTKQVGAFHSLYWSYSQMEKNARPDWRSYIEHWEEVAIQAAHSSPYQWEPEPDCEYCGGSGICETRYYPTSLFDYLCSWEIVRLDPENQPKNLGEYDAVLAPNCHLFKRRSFWHLDADIYTEEDKWVEKVREVLAEYPHCQTVKCIMHK